MTQTTHCGKEPFALQILGDSMAPEFIEGQVIIIDPDGVIENGSYVLAWYQGEYIFRQLIISGNKDYWLKPLNDQYPTLSIANLEAIKGIVVQRAGRRRKDRKHYV